MERIPNFVGGAHVEPASGDKTAEWGGTNYFGFDAFRNGTGQERNGRWGVPTYVNRAGGDMHLAAGSAGIDGGVVIPGFNDAASPWPFTGAAPDAGAFER